jgi:uncharacterized protein (TIGR02646 family)
MRAVRRANVLVPTLAATGAGKMAADSHVKLRAANADAKLDFSEHWNNEDVRGALYAMHGKACAYCGCHLPRNDRGDVEHFRPKGKVTSDKTHGGYWWLAYSFDNYLLSCSICNRVRKRDRFPIRVGSVRTTYSTRSQIESEARMLLDPTLDPVEDWLQADLDADLCRLKAHPNLQQPQRELVDATLKFFRINVDPRLVRERIELRDVVAQAVKEDRASDVSSLAIRFRPHSLIARQLLAIKAPQALPTPEEELMWLLNEGMADLDITLKLLQINADDAGLKRQAGELLWTFAVLWKDPPFGAPSDIAAFLQDHNVKDTVTKYFDQL